MEGMKRSRIVSGSTLKIIAAVSMLVDHVGAVLLRGYLQWQGAFLTAEDMAGLEKLYVVFRVIGRTAFPLFLFFLVEGFFLTKDRKKYALRLFFFACLSEIPHDLALRNRFLEWEMQNVLFSMLVCLLTLWGIEKVRGYIKEKEGGKNTGWILTGGFLQLGIVLVGMGTACLIQCEYTYRGVLLAVVYYLFYGYPVAAALGGYCTFLWEAWCFPAFLLQLLYNGKRGRKMKYFFYFFYPLHLLALYGVLRIFMQIP